MENKKAWIDYLIYFHCDQDYFECHEVLEEHWKSENKENDYWVGLIQIAVALYHQRRGNMNGAIRMMKSAISKLKEEETILQTLGLDKDKLLAILLKRIDEIEQHKKFEPLSLPLTSNMMIVLENEVKKQNKVWDPSIEITDITIIDKHKIRDRSSVIEERKKQQLQKKRQRNNI